MSSCSSCAGAAPSSPKRARSPPARTTSSSLAPATSTASTTRPTKTSFCFGMGAAIELADSDPAITDVEAILAGDIFHRYVVLGPVRSVDSVEGLVVRVLRDGEEIARTSEPAQLTGEIGPVLHGLRQVLEENGEALRAGDVVITGSVVPPIEVAPGQRLRAEMSTLGSVEVNFQEVTA